MEPNSEEKALALFSHLSAFIAPVIAPFVIMLVKADSQFVKSQAKQALVFHLAFYVGLFAVFVVSLGLAVVTHGIGVVVAFPLMGFMGLGYLILTIIGAMKSFGGEDYHYPLVGSLADKF